MRSSRVISVIGAHILITRASRSSRFSVHRFCSSERWDDFVCEWRYSSAGGIIEAYPQDTPYPSRLVLEWRQARPLHVVAANKANTGETIVITTYEPDPEEWDRDYKRGGTDDLRDLQTRADSTRSGHRDVGARGHYAGDQGSSGASLRECGEEYVDEDTTARLLRAAEEAARTGVQVDVRQYAAA